MAKRKQQHVHQYYKDYPYGRIPGRLGKIRAVWTCGLPDCSHYRPENMPEPVGKLSLCNECMRPYVIDSDDVKDDKPRCEVCKNPDSVAIPVDFDWERHAAKTRIAAQENIPLDQVPEEQIDRMVQFMRLERL